MSANNIDNVQLEYINGNDQNRNNNDVDDTEENTKLMKHEKFSDELVDRFNPVMRFLLVQIPNETKKIDEFIDNNNEPADYVLVYESEEKNNFTDPGIEIREIHFEDLELNNVTNIDPNKLTASNKRNIYLANLLDEGLKLKSFKKSNGKKKITYVFVHTPDNKLCEAAEKTRFKVQIERIETEPSNIMKGLYNSITKPFKLPDELTGNKQRDYVSVPFTSKLKPKIEKYTGKPFGKMLSRKDRSLLTYELLSQVSFTKLTTIEHASANDTKIGIERLLDAGVLNIPPFTSAYPLHESYEKFQQFRSNDDEENLRQLLYNHWAKLNNIFKFQPLHQVKEYFGEKVAFYFAWLGFYTTWLFFPSIIGIIVFLYGVATLPFDIPTREICNKNGIGNLTVCMLCDKTDICLNWKLSDSCLYSRIAYVFDNPATVFFSFAMVVWAVLFIEFWKRQQSELQYEWDVIEFENKYDSVRPDYERKVTHKRYNRVTQKWEPYLPFKQKFAKYLASISVVLFMISLIIALLISVIIYRITILILLSKQRWTRTWSNFFVGTTAASINLVSILILNYIYARLAAFLTKLELHRTESSYERSLTIKMYLFQFVNYYSSVFYVAFFKGRSYSKEHWFYEPCDPSGCLAELSVQLATVMIGQQIINNIQEFYYPKILKFISKKKQVKNKRFETFRWEKEYNLMGWTNTSLFNEYLEMVIQYGFITLFVVAFPLGPLCAFINNIIEIRIDAHKFLVQCKRPLAKRAQSIGIWLNILSTVSAIGVITNGLIIAFTSEFIPRLVYQISKNKTDLSGYMNYTLLEFFHNETEICIYRGYDPADRYQILVGRLAFVVIFEHLTFFLVIVLRLVIPDVSLLVKEKIENENSIVQRIIWQTNSDTTQLKARHRSRSLSKFNLNVLTPDTIILNNDISETET